MAQIIIRNLDDSVVDKLKQRAKASGRSLEAEARILLTNSVAYDPLVLRELRAKFGEQRFEDSTEMIREDRER